MYGSRSHVGVLLVAFLTASSAHADKAECLKAYEATQRHRKAGQLKQARRDLVVCAATECPALIKTDCTAWLVEVDRALPSVVFVARSEQQDLTDVRVSVDGALLAERLTGAALPVDPGVHVFRFEWQGRQVERKLTIREGEKHRREVVEFVPSAATAPEASQARALSPEVVALAGVGAIALASFGYFGVRGLNRRSDLAECKGRCSQDAVDDVSADFTRADVSLLVSALAFGGAAYFYFSAAPGAPKVGVTPSATGAAGFASIGF